MKQILLIGIGQTGSTVADIFLNKLNNSGMFGRALAIDTDEESLSEVHLAQKVFLTDECSLASTVEIIGEDTVKEYFPSDWERDESIFAKGLDMKRGANLWRAKAFLAFNSFLSKDKRVEELHNTLDAIAADCGEDGEIELYTAASLAGGTGSGLFIPIVLYIKKYLESIGGKVAFSSAFLAMPSIYKHTLQAERGTKSYANAYVALRELNAINLVAFNDYNSDKILSHPHIDFKIDLFCGRFKKLFDSDSEEFYTPSAVPFDKVTLFEKISTVNSVSEHIGVMTDALFLSCFDKREGIPNKTNPEAIVGCQSFTRVSYPINSIVDYITKKQTFTFISTEIGNIAKIAENHLQNKILNAKNEHRKFTNSVEQYRDSFISAVEEILDRYGNLPERLIGRIIDPNVKLDMPSDLYDSSWQAFLDTAVEKSVMNEGFEAVAKIISANRAEGAKKNTFAKKTKKEIINIVADIKPNLSKAFLDSQIELKEGKDIFVADILSLSEPESSFIGNIICENGKYLHPIYALFRLCLAHKTLEKYKSAWSPVPTEPRDNYPFPREILSVGNYRKKPTDPLPTTKYFRYGENRFEDLLAFEYGQNIAEERERENKKKRKCAVVTDDSETFFKDLENIYNKLLNGVKHYRYLTAIELLEKLIERYHNLMRECLKMSDDVRSDIELALISGSSSNAITVNVGASVEDKIFLCNKYFEDYSVHIDDMIANDVKISKNVALLALSDLSQTEIGCLQVKEMLKKTELIYKEYLESTAFYESFLNKDIMRTMKDSVESHIAVGKLSYSQIFGTRYNPLKIKIGNSNDNPDAVATSTITLSDAIACSILKYPERYEGKLPEDYVKGVVSEFVEYGTSIRFLPSVNDKELFVCKKTDGIELGSVVCVDEMSTDEEGYTAFKECVHNIKTRGTSMWNPSLIYSREGGQLPFISPNKQDEYEKSVAKAVIYAFGNDMLFIEKDKEQGEMYFVKNDFDKIPLYVGNLPVRRKDIKNVIRWAYENPDWTERNAKEYNDILNKSKINVLRDAMLELIDALDKQQALESEGYANCIAYVMNEKLSVCNLDKNDSLNERAIFEYSMEIKAFFDRLTEKFGAEQAKKYAKWFNSRGFFLDCSIQGGFCEFTFQ